MLGLFLRRNRPKRKYYAQFQEARGKRTINLKDYRKLNTGERTRKGSKTPDPTVQRWVHKFKKGKIIYIRDASKVIGRWSALSKRVWPVYDLLGKGLKSLPALPPSPPKLPDGKTDKSDAAEKIRRIRRDMRSGEAAHSKGTLAERIAEIEADLKGMGIENYEILAGDINQKRKLKLAGSEEEIIVIKDDIGIMGPPGVMGALYTRNKNYKPTAEVIEKMEKEGGKASRISFGTFTKVEDIGDNRGKVIKCAIYPMLQENEKALLDHGKYERINERLTIVNDFCKKVFEGDDFKEDIAIVGNKVFVNTDDGRVIKAEIAKLKGNGKMVINFRRKMYTCKIDDINREHYLEVAVSSALQHESGKRSGSGGGGLSKDMEKITVAREKYLAENPKKRGSDLSIDKEWLAIQEELLVNTEGMGSLSVDEVTRDDKVKNLWYFDFKGKGGHPVHQDLDMSPELSKAYSELFNAAKKRKVKKGERRTIYETPEQTYALMGRLYRGKLAKGVGDINLTTHMERHGAALKLLVDVVVPEFGEAVKNGKYHSEAEAKKGLERMIFDTVSTHLGHKKTYDKHGEVIVNIKTVFDNYFTMRGRDIFNATLKEFAAAFYRLHPEGMKGEKKTRVSSSIGRRTAADKDTDIDYGSLSENYVVKNGALSVGNTVSVEIVKGYPELLRIESLNVEVSGKIYDFKGRNPETGELALFMRQDIGTKTIFGSGVQTKRANAMRGKANEIKTAVGIASIETDSPEALRKNQKKAISFYLKRIQQKSVKPEKIGESDQPEERTGGYYQSAEYYNDITDRFSKQLKKLAYALAGVDPAELAEVDDVMGIDISQSVIK